LNGSFVGVLTHLFAYAALRSMRYRFWALTRYSCLPVYDSFSEPVRIVRVVHMRRDLPRVLAHLPD